MAGRNISKNEAGKLPLGFLLTIFVALILAHSMVTGLATLSGNSEVVQTKSVDTVEKAFNYLESLFDSGEGQEDSPYNYGY